MPPWLASVLVVAAAWVLFGLLFALLIGHGIRIADERSPGTGVEPRRRRWRKK